MAKKKIKRNNKYFIGGALEDFGNWNDKVSDKFMGSSLGKGLGKLGVSSSGLGGIANTAATAIGGLLAGENESGVGNALQGIGSLASNIPGIGGVIGAGVNLVGGVVNAAFGSKLNKEEIAKVEGQIDNLNSFTSNASDYDALASNYTNMPTMGYFSKDDIGSDGWFSDKAKNKWKGLRKEKELAEQWVQNSLFNNAQNIATNKQQSLEANYTAFGGWLNTQGGDFTNGITFINNGKSHEENPLEGVPMGIDSQGIPNLVEEGEVIFNDYVFSNRLRVPKAIRQKYKLRGVTFAEAAKELSKESEERPNDPISERGLTEFMNVLTQSQEEVRMKKDNNKYEDGGQLDTKTQALKRLREKANKRGKFLGGEFGGAGASSLFLDSPDEYVLEKDTIYVPYRETFNDAFGRARKAGLEEFMFDNKLYNTELGDNPNNNKAGEERFIEGILPIERTRRVKKANGGRLCNKFYDAGPIEIIDFPYSVYSSRPKDDFDFSKWFTVDKNNLGKVTDYTDAYRNYKFTADKAREWAKLFGNDESLKSYLSKGNKLEDLTDEDVQKGSLDGKHGWLHKARAMMANLDNVNTIDVDNIFKELNNTPFKPLSIKSVPIEIEDTIGELPEEKVKEIAPMKDNWLRYAPIVGSGLAVINDWFGGNEPDYSNADLFADAIRGANKQIGYRPIGNYLRYTPLDREFYLNRLDANTAAGRRAVMNTSGGNRAAALAGILATDYNYGNQLGDLARKAEEYNLEQRQKVEDFNRNTNIFNSEMGTKVDMFNTETARNQANLMYQLAGMRQAIAENKRTEKAANLTNFIQGLGDLGREITDRDKLRWLTEKGVLKSANGGKINRRKKRGGFTI